MRCGFTFVELIVVLAVIAILASICIPSYSQESDLQLTLMAYQLVSEIYHLQCLSECYGVAVLNFWDDAKSGHYVVFVNDDPVKIVHLPRNIFFGSDLGEIRYDNGWPMTGYTIALTGHKRTHYIEYVIIALSTGRIRTERRPSFQEGAMFYGFE